ncbi:HRDC domain protein [Candidatus Izimaplasma bacterium HR1]|jgi:superfamily I DNA and/or RNA helicase|uniref:AAA domain-containing protein n=1 Tax=Candidatus Izimoplasma sp. HR1 TaxID=1541959 RepID=UPI0004F88363|nr:HRDC domain protein [Candidatus Izimaplasma bacterium HR1]
MALWKTKLLEDLYILRENIREEEKQVKGIAPIICTDDVLEEISNKKPLKISDFLAISGLNRQFLDNYATKFLKVVMKHQTANVREVTVSKNAYKVLDHYKDRLTNISRRNPNLYMGKTVKRSSFDLASLNQDINLIKFLTNKRVSTLRLEFASTLSGENLERHITTLYRETNKEEKETGSYDLYIAYPYVEGVFKKDRFAIRAPLLYFPVKLERSKRNFSIKKDKDKDIIYNRDLLLATSKMEQSDIDSNAPYINDFSIKTLKDIVIPFYANNGINIADNQINFDFDLFKPQLKDKFVKRRTGVFEISENITIGRYKLYSSMIQKDMSKILDQNKYNELLEGLIDESNLYEDEKDVIFAIEPNKVEEKRLSYINEINYAQEKVIDLLNKEKKLVIWGPPGTGKSQTITSLIASSVLKGENVLVVSEKKVALDVIYSRLKGASKYSMFIDDAENKQDFYHKLKEFVTPSPPERTLNNDIFKLEEEIRDILFAMDRSLELLYHTSIQDVPMSLLYRRYVKDKEIIKELTPKKVHIMFRNTFKKPDFKVLDAIEKTFTKKQNLTDILIYDKMLSNYPVLGKLETKISRSNIIDFEEFSNEYKTYKEKTKHAWFIKRYRLKKQFIEKNKKRLLFLTKKSFTESKYLRLLLDDDTLHYYILENINKLNKVRNIYSKLTEPEHSFLHMLANHSLVRDFNDIAKYRKYLFDAFYTGYLEEFKAKNQKHLYIFDKYREKLIELDGLMNEKKQVTVESFEMELYKHAFNFANTKRIMDIKRVLENTRKPSVKAFIDIFQLELMSNVRVWMMTPEVVSAIIPLVYGMFDLVIFDEASQMYVEKGIPCIYRANKVVIAGDTKQLRPSSLGIGRLEDEDEFYEDQVLRDVSMDAKSLLDLARYKYQETILNYHYRSQYEELIAFSNHAFYEGKLIVSPNQTSSVKPPIEYVHVKDGVFENRRNPEEAKAVIKLIKKVFRERENNETIGVITFNSTQRDSIENLIDEELFKRSRYQKEFESELFRTEEGEDKSLFVKNIENVQGDERDIIIFSMGYARDPEGFVRRRFGWLNNDGGQNRLNVAISRAKRKIYFVSSLFPEELKVEDLKSTGPKLLKDYMRYCYYVSNKKPHLAKEVLNQLHTREANDDENNIPELVKDIQKRLERNNYKVETSIGIGNYSINLAIYNEETKAYSLGIICDVSNPIDLDARRDLFHQEKYLEVRNWKLYRVFASNWYTDPNKEMRNIRDLLK